MCFHLKNIHWNNPFHKVSSLKESSSYFTGPLSYLFQGTVVDAFKFLKPVVWLESNLFAILTSIFVNSSPDKHFILEQKKGIQILEILSQLRQVHTSQFFCYNVHSYPVLKETISYL